MGLRRRERGQGVVGVENCGSTYLGGSSQHTWLREFRRIFIHHHHCVITTLRMLVAAVCSAALRDGLVRSNEMIFFAIQTLLSSRRALRLVVA